MNNPEIVLISSCLVGINCRYDLKPNTVDKLRELIKTGKVVFICPEQTGGLQTPREPAEIEPGKSAVDVLNGQRKVITKNGKDVTKEYIAGAKETLKLCQDLKITTAILKARSPSCSSTVVYDGTFSGNKIVGNGITAQLLKDNGVKVFDEENYPQEIFE